MRQDVTGQRASLQKARRRGVHRFFRIALCLAPPPGIPGGFWLYLSPVLPILRVSSLLLLVLAPGGLLSLFRESALWSWVSRFLIMVVVVHVFLYWYAYRWRLEAYGRLLKANDWAVCRECGYLLKGLPSEGICPECGTSYERQRLAQYWSRWLADRTAGTDSPQRGPV